MEDERIFDVVSYLMGRRALYAKMLELYPTDTITDAAIASFPDGADGIPVKALTVDIDPVQDLHGYDNPWPAGGGKNKANPILTSQTINDVVITVNSDGTFKANGTSSADIRVIVATVTADSSASYILTGCPSGGSGTSYALMITDANSGDWASDYGSGSSAVSGSHVVSVTLVINNGTAVNNLTFKPMIRLSTESDATFTPYSNVCPISGWTGVNVWVEPTHDTTAAPKVTIDLDGAVYGGTLDVTTGVLTVDRKRIVATDKTWTFFSSQAGGAVYTNCSDTNDTKTTDYPDGKRPILSNIVPYNAEGGQGTMAWGGAGYNNKNIVITFGEFTSSLENWNTYISNNTVEFVYYIPEQTYQLTPTEVDTLLGTNNVWADTGNINTLTYRADVEKYIEKKLAEATA